MVELTNNNTFSPRRKKEVVGMEKVKLVEGFTLRLECRFQKTARDHCETLVKSIAPYGLEVDVLARDKYVWVSGYPFVRAQNLLESWVRKQIDKGETVIQPVLH